MAGFFLEHASSAACIVPVRYQPSGSDRQVQEAIAFMAKNGVRIVSIQSGRSKPWPAMQQAMAAHPEILFIVAAGNEGSDLSRKPRYPASYDLPNLLVVVGTNRNGTGLWERSNYGSRAQTIAYRAEDLNVAVFDGQIKQLSGTSFSAPAVSGIASQILAQNPSLSTQALINSLMQLARSKGRTVGNIPVLR